MKVSMMLATALFLAASLVVIESALTEVCSEDSVIKLSKMFGITQKRAEQERRVQEQAEILAGLEKELNATVQEFEEMAPLIENLSPTELQETEISQKCVPNDCCEIKEMYPSAESGLYAIKYSCAEDSPFSVGKIAVNCDMETDGGGWIVIQRRNASQRKVEFFRNWHAYENGFGDIDGEFWIGLKAIHFLTHEKSMSLQVSVWNDETNDSVTWTTPNFSILGPETDYRINYVDPGVADTVTLGPFHPRMSEGRIPFARPFSTYDRDNDYHSSSNCAYELQSAWWYYDCTYANLNGRHHESDLPGVRRYQQRLLYRTSETNPKYTVFTHSEMKIRPNTCGLR